MTTTRSLRETAEVKKTIYQQSARAGRACPLFILSRAPQRAETALSLTWCGRAMGRQICDLFPRRTVASSRARRATCSEEVLVRYDRRLRPETFLHQRDQRRMQVWRRRETFSEQQRLVRPRLVCLVLRDPLLETSSGALLRRPQVRLETSLVRLRPRSRHNRDSFPLASLRGRKSKRASESDRPPAEVSKKCQNTCRKKSFASTSASICERYRRCLARGAGRRRSRSRCCWSDGERSSGRCRAT